MSARGDDPRLHRIVVERNQKGEPTEARFVCDGDNTSPCHQWPACSCEEWTEIAHYADRDRTDRAPGHEDVPQNECWIDPWLNAATNWSELTDYYDGPIDIDAPENYGHCADWLVSGPVSVDFWGDYMTWQYAETTSEAKP